MKNKPALLHNRIKKTSTNNKNKLGIHVTKTSPKKIKKNNEKKNTSKSGELDEKGNPYPMENPEGGDPICPSGYKIDYDFDILDPINPPFRCIPALKDPTDGLNIINKLNNPSSNVSDLTAAAPAAGGGITKRMIRTRRQHDNGRRHRRRRTYTQRRKNNNH